MTTKKISQVVINIDGTASLVGLIHIGHEIPKMAKGNRANTTVYRQVAAK